VHGAAWGALHGAAWVNLHGPGNESQSGASMGVNSVMMHRHRAACSGSILTHCLASLMRLLAPEHPSTELTQVPLSIHRSWGKHGEHTSDIPMLMAQFVQGSWDLKLIDTESIRPDDLGLFIARIFFSLLYKSGLGWHRCKASMDGIS
jgi:hypothetical protein